MSKSLHVILRDIEKLQKQAAAIQSSVIDRIHGEIAKHGLTVEQLFGTGKGVGKSTKLKRAAAKPATGTRAAKYVDGLGNSWSGMGKRPGWLHNALAAGRALEEFLVMSTAGLMEPPEVVAKPAKPAKRASTKAKPVARNSAKKVEVPPVAAKKAASVSPAAANKPVAKKAKSTVRSAAATKTAESSAA